MQCNIITVLLIITQDEEAFYDAAKRGDVSSVRRLMAARVNVDCASHKVYMYIHTPHYVNKASLY